VPVIDQSVVGARGSQAPGPPADPAVRVLPRGFRWPPADPAGRLLPDTIARPSATLTDDEAPTMVMDPVLIDVEPPPRDPDQGVGSDPAQELPAVAASQAPDHDVPAEPVLDPVATAEHEPVAEPEPEADQESAADREPEPEPEVEHEPEPERSRLERPRIAAQPLHGRRTRRIRVVGLVAAFLILMVAGGVTLALVRPPANLRPSGHAASAAAGPVQMAAEWISQQVSRSTIVACDPAMCSALEDEGVPAANLLILRTTTASPLHAQLVVATPTVRSQFGSRLDSVYAPAVIAGFGSGSGRVNVQVVAPAGAAAYLTALRQDVAARQIAGAQLLANKHIVVTAEARRQLTAGEVDSRLLIMLPALAALHPIQVLAFGDPGPGATPGVPLCSADLSGSGQAAGMTDASYLSWLTSFVRAQLLPFAGSAALVRQGDQLVVRVEFSKPSPLGLLSHG
jgi:hypothetical protein